MKVIHCDLCGQKVADSGHAENTLGFKEKHPDGAVVDVRGSFDFQVMDQVEGEFKNADLCRACQRNLFLNWAAFLKTKEPAPPLPA